MMRVLRVALFLALMPGVGWSQELEGNAPFPVLDSIVGEGVTVFHAPEARLRAERLAALLDPPPALPALPADVPDSVRLFLAPTEEAFSQLIGSEPPEWGAAVALPAQRTIVLPGYPTRRLPPDQLRRVLLHEWAHVGLQAHMGNLRIPRWFSEGYAEWASGGWSVDEGWRLRVAIALNRTPPMDSLALGWPRDRASSEVAYLLAGSAIAYLASSAGERGLAIFFRRWKESGRFEEALRTTYGVTLGQFEEDWARHVKRQYGWLLVITRSSIFWALLVSVLGGMLLIRRRYNRERMARLRAGEPPDAPAWWVTADSPGRDPRFWDQGVVHRYPGGTVRIRWEPPPPETGPIPPRGDAGPDRGAGSGPAPDSPPPSDPETPDRGPS